MVRSQNDCMGRFSVEVELANMLDLARVSVGDIPEKEVRRMKVQGVVDTGATQLVIPESVVRQLGLQSSRKVRVRYADGRAADRKMVDGIRLSFGERSSIFSAIVEPRRERALIGAVVLETLDLLPDCTRQQLV